MGKQGHVSGTLPEICPCATELWASSFPAQAVNSALSHLYPNPAGPWVGCAHRGHWEHPWHSRHGHKAQSLHWSFGKQLLGHVLEAPPELALRGDSVQGHLPCRSQGVRERGSCSSPLPNPPSQARMGILEQDSCPSVPTQARTQHCCSGGLLREYLQLPPTPRTTTKSRIPEAGKALQGHRVQPVTRPHCVTQLRALSATSRPSLSSLTIQGPAAPDWEM